MPGSLLPGAFAGCRAALCRSAGDLVGFGAAGYGRRLTAEG